MTYWKEAARGCSSSPRAKVMRHDADILAEYERGCRAAGIAMAAACLLLGLGSAVFGW